MERKDLKTKYQVLELLRESPTALRPQQISDTLGLNGGTVRMALTHLKKEGLVINESWGLWFDIDQSLESDLVVPEKVNELLPAIRKQTPIDRVLKLKRNLYELMEVHSDPIQKSPDMSIIQEMKGAKGFQFQYVSVNTTVFKITIDCLREIDDLLEMLRANGGKP